MLGPPRKMNLLPKLILWKIMEQLEAEQDFIQCSIQSIE